ncbi:serine/threonine-protein kinase par-1-like isoform X2 [Argopecten irradians]|uniref:serine/threonine-protein kinase par-1-like isoform X2 n=1 Tax=Argopecten irradians TaxID=31199 RepID=UPI003722B93F
MGKKIQCIGRYVMDGLTLGKGNFARVELATHGVTACKVAIKIIDTRKIKEEYVRQNLHREARILGQLRHPNIVRLYETLKATTLYCLVLECASGGNLLAYIKTFKDFLLPEDRARPYLRQLVSAVHYLHEKGVAHRDLKMENIMLDEKKKNIKIVDFGLSNTFNPNELMKTHCGSLEYAAPELFTKGGRYGPEIDIWSIGIVLYAIVVGKLPFTTPYTDQYRREKLLQQIEKGLTEQHNREMAHITSECKDILKKILEPNPDLRLPVVEIEKHPWVTHNEKMPFYVFHAFPRDKGMKAKVMDELSDMLSMKKDQVEKTVHECKCDDLSAMFNMIMDNKRSEKGLFEIDYTTQPERKLDIKTKKHKRKTMQQRAADLESGGTSRANHVGHQADGTELSPKTGQSGEGQPNEAHKVSASFDFMALCSAPSWLGPEKKRSKPRRSLRYNRLMSPNQASDPSHSNDTINTIPNNPSNPNLLSPGQPGQMAFNRRSFSRRSSQRKKRSSSYGPGNRRTNSLKDVQGSSSSQPNSPTSLLSPSIRIDPPRPLPIQRPKDLSVKGCYHLSPFSLHVPANKSSSFCNLNGPVMHAREKCRNNSDSSNPCSTTELLSCAGSLDALIDPSNTDISLDAVDSGQKSAAEAKISSNDKLECVTEDGLDSVEARIALVDIKSIVRPKVSAKQDRKQIVTSKVSSVCDSRTTLSASSLEPCVVPSSMQSSEDKNPRIRCAQCCELNVSDCSKASNSVTQLFTLDTEINEDQVDSTTELLGATKMVDLPEPSSMDITDRGVVCCNSDRKESIKDKLSTDDARVPPTKNGPRGLHYRRSSELVNALEYSPDVEAYLEDGRSSVSTRCSNMSLYNLVMPNTPTRQMFQMPLARIESFHSDDFDALATDIDFTPNVKSTSSATTPSSSVNTPTMPCFAYKLHLHKKKNAKLKANKFKNSTSNGKDMCVKETETGGMCNSSITESELRIDPSCSEPLLSSGSDGGVDRVVDEVTDKSSSVSKAKIHPMDRDEQDTNELILRGTKINNKSIPKNKCTNTSNASESTGNDVKARKQQNSHDKTSKANNSENKKVSIKCSPWKHGFVHFLRKKRQGQGYRAGSHNNNDSINSNYHSSNSSTTNTRNGHTRTSYSKPLLTAQEEHSGDMETQFSSSPLPTFSDALEVRSSPVPGHTPTPSTTKVFDFTVITSESPQAKSCLLSWRGCRECFSDDQLSEDGGSECTFRFEQSVDVAIKTTMAIKSVQDAKNYSAYKYAHT